MNIGFDAKRFFHNHTGLGNYSRTLLKGLATYYPQHQYFLFNPKPSKTYSLPNMEMVHEKLPINPWDKKFPSLWRTFGLVKDLKKTGVDLYHGLSHEIPVGINNTCIKSVVTIHDLVFERYPQQYKKTDIFIYRKKFKYACANADRIIAASLQTKTDLIELYGVAEQKIDVCYQSCHPAFSKKINLKDEEKLRSFLKLPEQFFLYVGSIIERKNLLSICKAMLLLDERARLPLVVIGNGKAYKQKVRDFLIENNLHNSVIFLSDDSEFFKILQTPEAMAGVYQMATALIYPSLYEGFGIPILEALSSGLPVITSNTSCMPETGGNAALYVSPHNEAEIALAMQRVCNDEVLRKDLITKGAEQAAVFSLYNCTTSVMDVYEKLIK